MSAFSVDSERAGKIRASANGRSQKLIIYSQMSTLYSETTIFLLNSQEKYKEISNMSDEVRATTS